jgi:outer membrane biosynthesis protein TonB
MLPPRRVIIAFAASLVLHGILFSVLALTSAFEAVATPSPEGGLAASEPLEVVFQATPRAEEKQKMAFRVEEKEPPLLARMEEAAVERTQLDPASLKKSEEPPEHPEFLAAHHSSPSTQKPKARPQPTPVVSANQPSFRTANPALPPEPAAAEEESEEEIGVAAIGAWKKAVANAVGSRWDVYRRKKLDLLAVGSVRMKFTIDARGRVANVRVASNTAGPTNATYASRSISEAEIPPIPPDRLARLPDGRVEVEYTFTIYPAH